MTWNHETTRTCRPVTINNLADSAAGVTRWRSGLYQPPEGGHISNSFYNDWIWNVPFSAYQSGQTNIVFPTDSLLLLSQDVRVPAAIDVSLDPSVPLPFDSFSLKSPRCFRTVLPPSNKGRISRSMARDSTPRS